MEDIKRFHKRGKTVALIECPVCCEDFEREYRYVYTNRPDKNISVCSRSCSSSLSWKGLDEIKQLAEGSIKSIYTKRLPVEYNKDTRTFRGRKITDEHGYDVVYWPEHPVARPATGMVAVHRVIAYENGMEIEGKDVHHANENKRDHDPSNLIPLTRSEHGRLHALRNNSVKNLTPGNLKNGRDQKRKGDSRKGDSKLVRKKTNEKEIVCDNCGESFKRDVNHINEGYNFCSISCSSAYRESVEWPSSIDVLEMVIEEGYSATGRMIGVSDNAVRKFLKRTLGEAPKHQKLKELREKRKT